MNHGVVFALLAYVLWGIFPVYFKQVQAVSPLEMLALRVIWSLVFVAGVLAVLGRWQWIRQLLREPRRLGWFTLSAVVVSINWLIYIWAVGEGRIVDASLGYFINPLLNVLIGAVFLHERLRLAHWVAVLLAAVAVTWLTWQAGRLPWIGLTLAASFATYGLVRKKAPLGAIEGLAVETTLLMPIALAYAGWLMVQHQSVFVDALGDGRYGLVGWLLLAGPITAVPLLLFAAGARRIPFATLGILQYVGPSLQLLIGVWIYGEAFEPAKLAAYSLIWLGFAVFSVESLWRWRSLREADAAAAPSARA